VTGLCRTMQIREANETDFDVLVTLLRDSFRDVAQRFGLTVENCPKSPAFYTKQRIKEDFERGVKYYILEENGKAFGCVAFEKAGPDFCYLERLAVLPEHRRNGCGKALVNHVFNQARKMGLQRIEIGMIAKDAKLKNWYRKFGFIVKGTKRFDHLPFEVAFMYADVN
jgi:N-acetylglutamate synthase-like GNAT family acetyltransferase